MGKKKAKMINSFMSKNEQNEKEMSKMWGCI
jgi:hypothetical protein